MDVTIQDLQQIIFEQAVEIKMQQKAINGMASKIKELEEKVKECSNE